MPKNTTILIIRHAEKPDSGKALSLAGVERAAAYVPYFQNFTTVKDEALKIEYLFAAKSTEESERPVLTLTPLAKALGRTINSEYKDQDYEALAKHILEAGSAYDDTTLLICWHHEQALHLAEALGVPDRLPSTLPWPPPKWPEEVFGWVLVIVYGADGQIDFGRTMCLSTALMYDDYGQEPPGPVT